MLGFIVATVFSYRGLRREGGDVQSFWDVAFLLLFGGLVGARIHYVLNNLPTFYYACMYPALVGRQTAGCFEALMIWKGGLAWFGGFILALTLGVLYVRRRGYNPWQWADVIVPSVFLGLGVGRLGCFSAADDFGKPTDLPWGMRFPHLVGYPEMQNAPLHPAQLYMLAKDVVVFLVGYVWMRRRKQYHGQAAAISLAVYCALRFVVEIFRGDYRRGFIAEWDVLPPSGVDFLSNGQLVALVLLVASLIGMKLLRRAGTPRPASPPPSS